MKANQKHLQKFLNHEEEAVSPVIAVILMVAITVVLAATVFVLVSDLGGDVGKSGPKVSLVTDTTSSTTKWIVKVSDATQSADLTDYQFVLSTPSHGTIVADPDSNAFTSVLSCLSAAASDGARVETVCTDAAETHEAGSIDYLLNFTDVSGDSKWNTLDTLTITYDSGDGGITSEAFATGAYKLEIRHKTSNTLTGSVSQGF